MAHFSLEVLIPESCRLTSTLLPKPLSDNTRLGTTAILSEIKVLASVSVKDFPHTFNSKEFKFDFKIFSD